MISVPSTLVRMGQLGSAFERLSASGSESTRRTFAGGGTRVATRPTTGCQCPVVAVTVTAFYPVAEPYMIVCTAWGEPPDLTVSERRLPCRCSKRSG